MSDYHHILVNHPDAVVRVDIHGGIGARGKSAYQSYVDTTTDDPILTEEEWSSASATPEWDAIANKPATFPPSAHTHTFASLTSKPTTLDGYGITDAMPAPLELTAPPEDGVTVASQLGQIGILSYGYRLIIEGDLTSDGSTPVVFQTFIEQGGDVKPGWAPDEPEPFSESCLWNDSLSRFELVHGGDLMWISTDDVITPDLCTTWIPQGTATGDPIITLRNPIQYSFRCVNLSPMTWEGATPGLLYNATLGEWRIATLTGADGSESITYGPL